MGPGVAVAHFGVDEDFGALVADVGIVDEDAAACYLVLFDSIGDGNLRLGNEPDIAIDAAVVGEVEGHLLLARGVGLVVAVVVADGDDKIIAHIGDRERDGDGQIATLVVLDLLAIEVDGLFAHDGLEMEGNITTSTLLGQHEVLAIPRNALIVTATTGLGRHQLDGMRGRHHLPRLVVKVLCPSPGDIA